MGTDPLDARRRTLLRLADHIALQVSAHPLADRWWDNDEPRAALADRVRAEVARLREAVGAAEQGAIRERNATASVAPSLVEVKDWVSECRRRLVLARPDAARSVDEVRGALQCDLRRLAGCTSMLRSVIWELGQQRPALEPELPVDALLERARALLATLETHAAAVDAAAAHRLATATEAGAALTALRRLLQYVRRVWAVAVARSDGELAPLDWGIGRAEVMVRRAKLAARAEETRDEA